MNGPILQLKQEKGNDRRWENVVIGSKSHDAPNTFHFCSVTFFGYFFLDIRLSATQWNYSNLSLTRSRMVCFVLMPAKKQMQFNQKFLTIFHSIIFILLFFLHFLLGKTKLAERIFHQNRETLFICSFIICHGFRLLLFSEDRLIAPRNYNCGSLAGKKIRRAFGFRMALACAPKFKL